MGQHDTAVAAKPPRIYAVLLSVLGLIMAGGGLWLVLLGGSYYYLAAGIALVASGVFLWRGQMRGAYLYGLVLAATVLWALWEVGLDGWGLMPRLLAPVILGLWLLLPRTRRGLSVLLIAGMGLTSMPDAVAAGEEWPVYGGDKASTRYTTLDQLTPENVNELEEVWSYRTGRGKNSGGGLQVTPLMVNDTLYLCTPLNEIVALDPETGEEKWYFDPEIAKPLPRSCRGVTYFEVPGGVGSCAKRIITATTDARLLAVDADTGKACQNFGDGGATDLSIGMGELRTGYYYITSPPTLIRGNVVLGGWVSDNQYVGEPSGVIRAYNATTGAFAWAWDLGNPGYYGIPPEGETYTRGTPNSWAPASVDEELGLIYMPMGNATPDYWGAHRSAESDQYASSIVALNGETGEPVWSFQTVHHDVWDYDVGSPPTLIDLEIDGEIVPALLQPTKQGQIYLLDRRTGEPLADVEEKPVPQGAAAGDYLSPTQPFSVGMPDFENKRLTEANMWGLTPLDQLYCRIKFRLARYEGPFTPPGERPSITYPGYMGGMEWGGVSVDPTRNLMVVNWTRFPNYTRLVPRAEADAMGVKAADEGISGVGKPAAQEGTPYAAESGGFLSFLGVPCTSPPYGLLTLVDLNTREIVWERPLGTAQDLGPMGIPSNLPIEMGVPNIGGSVTTRSGLIFIASAMEHAFHAIDIKTGDTLWKGRLPAAGHATPMTYISPSSGRQFVVTAAGGHFALGGVMGGKMSDHIVAFARPVKD
ncbi:MAG: membrane-bound PQQ-dependent dehydrogenase, glucose/quinate/shikimate family [Alphaproteobacteria bacterium]|nr:MAG: membrane-bound PQQ-dependent dehydrogenase, glucose/quinate/shikimate family [Alphaproteobacteria bacterium]